MKKILLTSFISALLLNVSHLSAQQSASSDGGQQGYKTGIGLRLGWEGGISLKHFIKERRAIEGIASFGWGYRGFRLTGLYEIHKRFPDVDGLDWYFGFGAHVGAYAGHYFGYYGYSGGGYYDKQGRWHPSGYRSMYPVVGIDGVLGLEYQIEDVPLTIGLDIKPYINIIGWGSQFADGALTVRYIID